MVEIGGNKELRNLQESKNLKNW